MLSVHGELSEEGIVGKEGEVLHCIKLFSNVLLSGKLSVKLN